MTSKKEDVSQHRGRISTFSKVFLLGLVCIFALTLWSIYSFIEQHQSDKDAVRMIPHRPLIATQKILRGSGRGETNDGSITGIKTQKSTETQLEKINEKNPSELFLKYWKDDIASDFNKAYPKNDHQQRKRYLTFEDDTGGWNNIRMAFEVFVVIAKMTGRTLVLPPPCRFYLLDRGPIQLFEKSKDSYSEYNQYFNIDSLKKELDIITTREFFKLEAENMNIPIELVEQASKVQTVSNGHHTDYFLWLRTYGNGVIWPTGPGIDTEKVFDIGQPNPQRIHEDKLILHFPMHVSKNFRYLNGVPALLAISSASDILQKQVKQYLRDNLHYQEWIIHAAAYIIEKLGGPMNYNAAHIRRNDLQYKSVFIGSQASIGHMIDRLGPSKGKDIPMYIATDETESGFFEAYKEQNIMVKQLLNYRQDPGYLEAFRGLHAVGKYEGMVEQLVCACAKEFFGTPMSTYTSYIMRLRGYMKIDSSADCNFHTSKEKRPCPGDVMLGRGI